MTLHRAIERAAKNGVINEGQKETLLSFKETIRNPYNHYNIQKITESVSAPKSIKFNLETGEHEEIELNAKEHIIVQPRAKIYMDGILLEHVFKLLNDIVWYFKPILDPLDQN